MIQRLATLDDVRKLEKRKPDKRDREALSLGCYVVVSNDARGTLRLYHTGLLRADGGWREIDAVVEACKANGGRAP